MKISKNLKLLKDKRYSIFFLLVAFLIAFLLAVEEVLDQDYTHWSEVLIEFLITVPLYFITSYISSIPVYPIISWLNKKYPWDGKSFRRFGYEILIMVSLVGLFTITASVGSKLEIFKALQDPYDGSKFEILTMLMFFIGFSLTFAFTEYLILNEDKNRISLVAKDLEKQNLISKYEALRNQVNPHFLFNSLNVLSSLIYSDIKLSDQFIQKFSEVFRYVLELNKQELVTLEKELEFMESYIFLQKIRHDNRLKIIKEIATINFKKYLPPLALQMVIENAFKHNIISESSPLVIHLHAEASRLHIMNNYKPRKDNINSTGLGQKNLIEQYGIIGNEMPEFYIEEGYYIAELPLITLNKDGSSNY